MRHTVLSGLKLIVANRSTNLSLKNKEICLGTIRILRSHQNTDPVSTDPTAWGVAAGLLGDNCSPVGQKPVYKFLFNNNNNKKKKQKKKKEQEKKRKNF